MKTKTILFGFFCAAAIASGDIHIIKTQGSVYEIHEQNIVELIKKHVENNKDKIEAKLQNLKEEQKKKIQAYKPPDLSKTIAPAKKDAIRYPDPSYVLKDDIKDANGSVLYPKGYKFNPLHYIQMTDRYVFFDYTQPEQVEWIKNKKFDEQLNVRLIMTDGRVFDAMKEFNREVFYANDQVLNRFDIQATPTLAYQEGDRIRLEEFFIPKDKLNKKTGETK